MTTPVDRAPVQQQQTAAPEAVVVGAAAPKINPTTPRWVPGLLAACAAITLAAVRGPPPPGLDKHAYFLALSAAFFAGVAGIMAVVVSVSDDDTLGRCATACRLVFYSSVAALAVAVGLLVASLL